MGTVTRLPPEPGAGPQHPQTRDDDVHNRCKRYEVEKQFFDAGTSPGTFRGTLVLEVRVKSGEFGVSGQRPRHDGGWSGERAVPEARTA